MKMLANEWRHTAGFANMSNDARWLFYSDVLEIGSTAKEYKAFWIASDDMRSSISDPGHQAWVK